MNIDRNAVILAAKESSSLEMLASKFHRENNEEFRDEMENICPGFEKLIELNEVSEAMKEAYLGFFSLETLFSPDLIKVHSEFLIKGDFSPLP